MWYEQLAAIKPWRRYMYVAFIQISCVVVWFMYWYKPRQELIEQMLQVKQASHVIATQIETAGTVSAFPYHDAALAATILRWVDQSGVQLFSYNEIKKNSKQHNATVTLTLSGTLAQVVQFFTFAHDSSLLACTALELVQDAAKMRAHCSYLLL